MKMQPVAVALTAINLVIMIVLLAQMRPAMAQQQPGIAPVVKTHALHILDNQGKIRASITVEPAVEVDGKQYPQTTLLRLIDNQGKPLVKLTAAENGSALGLSDELDGGVLIRARDTGTFVKLNNRYKERVIRP
ncbi:hypothetical protein [Foetidibacter luteolus]|uniref:hypothetical protein n=1 Tax=Foetidibacter luteolus TaxID=2608880 RepID=UPI00129B74B2|nr:hypothetical protein [Foetidibacter luteolus]